MQASAFNLLMHACFVLTLGTQLFVLHCVRKHSPSRIKEYKHYLFNFLACDLLYTLLLGLFLSPLPAPRLVGVIVQGISTQLNAYYSGRGTISALIYAASHVIMAQNLCLLYRFIVVVCENKQVFYAFVSWKTKFLYFVLSQTVAISLGVFVYQVFIPPEDVPNQLVAQNVVLPAGFEALENVVVADIRAPITHAFLGTLLLLFGVSETICIGLIVLIMRKLRGHRFSIQSYRLHVQFTVHLAANLALPGILIIAPSAAFAVGALFNLDDVSDTIAQVAIFMNGAYATMNALSVIVFVQSYRAYTFELLVWPWLRFFLSAKWTKRIQPDTVVQFSHGVNSHDLKPRRSTLV